MSCGLYLSQWGASGSESCWLVGLLGGSMSRWDSDEEIPLQKYKHCIDNCWKKIFSSLSENIEQHLIFLTFLINSDYAPKYLILIMLLPGMTMTAGIIAHHWWDTNGSQRGGRSVDGIALFHTQVVTTLSRCYFSIQRVLWWEVGMGRDFRCLIDQERLCPTGKRNGSFMDSCQSCHHTAK